MSFSNGNPRLIRYSIALVDSVTSVSTSSVFERLFAILNVSSLKISYESGIFCNL